MAAAAPPSLRLASAAVDTAVVGALDALLSRRRGGRSAGSGPSFQRLAVGGCYTVAALGLAGRTCGHALCRLRVLNAAAGGRPGWRAAVTWWVLRRPADVLLVPVVASTRLDEAAQKVREVKSEVDELRRRFEGDWPRFYRAAGDLYTSRGVDVTWRAWGPVLAALVSIAYECVMTAGVVLRRDRRGLHDRVAGVVVVREPAGA